MSLRDYQQEALRAIVEARDAGVSKQLIVLPTGCHRYGQPILMFDGSVKPVQHILPGDQLMGPDSTSRIVTSLRRNTGQMYEIAPVKGEPFVVNEDHLLTLVRTQDDTPKANLLVDVPVRQILHWSKWNRHIHKLIRTGVNFPEPHQPLIIPPYLLGLFLGDGHLGQLTATSEGLAGICFTDPELIDATYAYAQAIGLHIHPAGEGTSTVYQFSGTPHHTNPITLALKVLGLWHSRSGNKFIPAHYKTAYRNDRLAILAGLMDTDGSLTDGGYDYVTKSLTLAEDIAFISRSLGLAAYIAPCIKTCQTGASGDYYRVSISGDCSIIPCKVKRKQAPGRRQKKSVLRTGFSIHKLGVEPYYGFTLTGDRRYLMGDFTITHNTGKTQIFAHLPETIDLQRKMIVLVHRDELVFQTVDKLKRYNPDAVVAIEKARFRSDQSADMVVASVGSLYKARLAKFTPSDYGLVIVDEAHHAIAASYKNILEHFHVLKGHNPDPDRLLCGFTATPKRGDSIGLEAIFDQIVYQRNIRDMVEQKWLADIVAWRVNTLTDISEVGIARGDFAEGELADVVNTYPRNRLIVEQYKKRGEGMTAVAFTVSIQHSEDLADVFRSYGINAHALSSKTPMDERREMIRQHRAGELTVLCSCNVVNEGFDNPLASVALMARPTKSSLLYIQQLGRVLRPYPAPEDPQIGWIKPYAVVLDFADQTGRHSIISVATLFGLRADFDVEGKSVEKTKREIEELLRGNPGLDVDGATSLREIQAIVERVDLLSAPRVPPEIVAGSKYAWLRDNQDGYRLTLPDKMTTLYIRENTLGQFEVHRSTLGTREPMGVFSTLKNALARADGLVPASAIGAILSTARWRQDEPTFKQAKLLHWKDPRVRSEFHSAEAFYDFAQQRYKSGNVDFSKGGLSSRIDSILTTIKR